VRIIIIIIIRGKSKQSVNSQSVTDHTHQSAADQFVPLSLFMSPWSYRTDTKIVTSVLPICSRCWAWDDGQLPQHHVDSTCLRWLARQSRSSTSIVPQFRTSDLRSRPTREDGLNHNHIIGRHYVVCSGHKSACIYCRICLAWWTTSFRLYTVQLVGLVFLLIIIIIIIIIILLVNTNLTHGSKDPEKNKH